MSPLNALFSALLLSSAALGAPALCQEDASSVALDVEYDRLYSRYANALETWAIEEKKMRRNGVPQNRLPKAPGFEYQPGFLDLAKRGSVDARLWMIQNPAFHGETAPERRAVLQHWYRMIVEENADFESMGHVIEELGTSKRRLGEEFILAMLAEIPERSTNAEFIVGALYHRAWILSDGMATKDAERRAEAMEIFSVIVAGYPTSKEAAKSAGVLYAVESNDLRKALHRWCDECRAVLAEGAGPDKWPANPMHQAQPKMAVLAASGSGRAQQWTAQFYPAFDQRDRRSQDLGALWLGQEISNRRSAAEHVWMDLKFDILDLAAEVSGEADWAFDLVKGLDEEVSFFLPDRYGPLLRKVIEISKNDRVREQAQLTLARSLSKGETFPELSQALALFKSLEREGQIERIQKEAEEHREGLERVMPGAVSPELIGKDAEGIKIDLKAYEGKVLVLWFWSFTRAEEGQFEAARTLIENMKHEDFAFLGVNCDLRSPAAFRRQADKEGIGWRNALQYRPTGHMTDAFGVHHWPTALVIGVDGVLRGRSIDLVACEALSRELLEDRIIQEKD